MKDERAFRRGEIYLADLGTRFGSEQGGIRPVLILQNNLGNITYKLKLNGGDIKAVQGDSGHSQAKMVTDTYSHILDDGRKNNALLFQEAFYEAKTEPKEKTPEGLSPETLSKMLANPEVMALLTALAKQMG